MSLDIKNIPLDELTNIYFEKFRDRKVFKDLTNLNNYICKIKEKKLSYRKKNINRLGNRSTDNSIKKLNFNSPIFIELQRILNN